MDGSVSWQPCAVIAYDNKEEKFLIRWKATGREKYVTRLNIQFDVEDPELFQKRVNIATQLKTQAEEFLVIIIISYFVSQFSN